MQDLPNTKRCLEWFQKKRGYLSGEETITSLTLDDLRKIFDVKDIDPENAFEVPDHEGYDPYMLDSYQVKACHVAQLQPYFKQKINLTKHNYYVSAYDNTPLEEQPSREEDLKRFEAIKWEKDDPKKSIDALPNMKRSLRWFKKNSEDDHFIGEEVTSELDIYTLREIFDLTCAPYLMTDEDFTQGYHPKEICGYNLSSKDVEKLQPYFKHKINLNKYHYFLTGYQEKKPPPTE
jgi:hypothetical protein